MRTWWRSSSAKRCTSAIAKTCADWPSCWCRSNATARWGKWIWCSCTISPSSRIELRIWVKWRIKVNRRDCGRTRYVKGCGSAQLLVEALGLPTEARAELADSLLESLDTEVDEGVEEAWRQEIQQRLGDIDSGAVELI